MNESDVNKSLVFFLIEFPSSWIPRQRQEELRRYFDDEKSIETGRKITSGMAEKVFYSLLFVAHTRPLLMALGILSLPGIILSLLFKILG